MNFKKIANKLQKGRPTNVFGYDLDEDLLPVKRTLPPLKEGVDTGADPLGDGTFKMFPSGDIVDATERNRRLTI